MWSEKSIWETWSQKKVVYLKITHKLVQEEVEGDSRLETLGHHIYIYINKKGTNYSGKNSTLFNTAEKCIYKCFVLQKWQCKELANSKLCYSAEVCPCIRECSNLKKNIYKTKHETNVYFFIEIWMIIMKKNTLTTSPH